MKWQPIETGPRGDDDKLVEILGCRWIIAPGVKRIEQGAIY